MTPWEGRGAHYIVGEKSIFHGKRVLIVGGGDSAMDWVINLLDTASEIRLVHRREGFRAHGLQLSSCLRVTPKAPANLLDLGAGESLPWAKATWRPGHRGQFSRPLKKGVHGD